MRKILAIAILIGFVAPVSAAGWTDGSVRGHSGTAEHYAAAARAAMARRRLNNDAEIRAINAQAAADQSAANRNAAGQDNLRSAKDAIRKMMELRGQANNSGCGFCR